MTGPILVRRDKFLGKGKRGDVLRVHILHGKLLHSAETQSLCDPDRHYHIVSEHASALIMDGIYLEHGTNYISTTRGNFALNRVGKQGKETELA